MSDHAIHFEYDEPVPPPVKPIKGAWGVGKEYRKHRRHYAKAMRAYKRSEPATVHRKIYIPHASFQVAEDAFEVFGRAAADASEAITNSFERFYANDPVIVSKRELLSNLYGHGFDRVKNEDVVLEGTIVDPPMVPVHLWGVDPIEGPDDYTYDKPIPTKASFSAEIQFEPIDKNIRKLFGLL